MNCPPGLTVVQQRDWAFSRLNELTQDLEALRKEARVAVYGSFAGFVHERLGLRPGCVRLILVLAAANGRCVDDYVAAEHIALTSEELADPRNLVKQTVCVARKRLGRDSMKSIWGHGYCAAPSLIKLIADLREEFGDKKEAA